MKYEELKAKFPDASSVGGEVIARVNGETIVVANYVDNTFVLTKKAEGAPVEEKAPKQPRKSAKQAKDAVVEEVVDGSTDLDAIFGE